METREVVLSAAENKDGQLMANTWVVQFITWGHNKHKTSGWAAHPPGGSSTGAKVGLPCPGGVCMYIVCVYTCVHVCARVCMCVHAGGLQSHRDLHAGGPTAGAPAEFGRVEVSCLFCNFFMVN